MFTEVILFWLALGCYVLSSIAYMSGLVFTKEKFIKTGFIVAMVGILLHVLSLGFRWIQTGHGPYINTYEILSSTALTTVIFFLFLEWRKKAFSSIGAGVMPLSFLLMGFALMGSTEAKNLPPTLRSLWLVVHVIFAKLFIASVLIAVALAIFYLLKSQKKHTGYNFLTWLPSIVVLDDLGYKLIVFGFISLTIMIITGSIWANNSWGSYWSWDPTQTWSLVLWLVYGLYLHGRITFGWKGVISAWYVIFAFGFSILTFFIIPYFIKGLHAGYMIG